MKFPVQSPIAAAEPDRLNVLVLPSWYPSVSSPIGGVFVADQVQVLATRHRVAVLVPQVSSVHGLWDPGR